MKIVCWNTNDAVWHHWQKVMPTKFQLERVETYDQSVYSLQAGDVVFCFVYLAVESFSTQVEMLVQLKKEYPSVPMVACPDQRSQSAAMRLLSNGIEGQCAPYVGARQLGLVLSVIEAGEIWGGKEFIQSLITQTAAATEQTDESDNKLTLLTGREREVAIFVSEGFSNKQIADKLSLTERTVKAHLTSCFKKLDIKDRLGLALLLRG